MEQLGHDELLAGLLTVGVVHDVIRSVQGPYREETVVLSALDNGLVLRGEVDLTTGAEIQRALLGPDGEATRHTVMDLGQVTFMDSTGINALIGARQAATAIQGWVRVAGPTAYILRVLQLVGLDTVMPCYPTLQQALSG
ncbi:STAS domain-containing protein [Streptomyces sp. NBC_01340]|uniref:STAS domain-containing protein n=1 Tax=unclassified Streptomyces TaxID=2593676 RepID=UPI00224F0CC3|nr:MULTISPECIES: STAS domain-containing protein [unclassified Streptomyces]MCX4457962.1 STAS domain-containing protein [Streptomyces sp. NBC_01719]MCX4497319.1 STAS domain-containing protein [Streptomyces sp. NBC_01728]WSI42167.1 STAS domain-containing protein [Streptomyces sp. NBC_01340]